MSPGGAQSVGTEGTQGEGAEGGQGGGDGTLLRSSISIKQLDCAGELLQKWLKVIFPLHPTLNRASNLHSLRHLLEDIKQYGPVYEFWGFFATERLNYIAKPFDRAGSLRVPPCGRSSSLEKSTLFGGCNLQLARQRGMHSASYRVRAFGELVSRRKDYCRFPISSCSRLSVFRSTVVRSSFCASC